MVIFHHGDAAEDKGEEVRGGAMEEGASPP